MRWRKLLFFNQYFFNNFNHAYTSTDYSWLDSVSTLSPSSIPEEYLPSDEQILGLLTSLNTRKASGADGITALMLKATGISIAKGITKLFNLFLKTGIFPTDWKFARVVPIPKLGNPDSPSNYRPISTLPIISKLLENMYIISSVNTLVRTVHYLQTNGVLLRVNQPPLPFSHLCMNVKRLWIMEVKSVLCFLTSAKLLTQSHINHFYLNYSSSK